MKESAKEDHVIPTRGNLPRFRVWHLCLLTAFVAIAIANIQDQRIRDPVLIAVAVAGFVLYAILGWLGWRFARRFRAHLGEMPFLSLYFIAMSALFLIACVVYVMIENAYLFG